MSILERLRQIEPNFNRSYLLVLSQLRDAMSEPWESEKDEAQYKVLCNAYNRWSKMDVSTTESCTFFHNAVGNLNDRLLHRDETFFHDGRDFFSVAYDTPGIDTMHIYSSLDEGESSDADSDAKLNLWTALIGLDRLSVLICIYLAMPQVKQMIDIILTASPNVTQGNLMGSIMQQFKSKKELRQLVMKLTKTKTETFEDIFNSLQRVIATFNVAGPSTTSKNSTNEVEALAKSVNVELHGAPGQYAQLWQALQDKNDNAKAQLINQGIVTAEAMIQLETALQNKVNAQGLAANLGKTMQDMMTAINSGDEKQLSTLFEKSGADMKGLNLGAMQEEMQALETEFEYMEYESLASDANIVISGNDSCSEEVLWKALKTKDETLKAQVIEAGVISAEDLVKLEGLIVDSLRKEDEEEK